MKFLLKIIGIALMVIGIAGTIGIATSPPIDVGSLLVGLAMAAFGYFLFRKGKRIGKATPLKSSKKNKEVTTPTPHSSPKPQSKTAKPSVTVPSAIGEYKIAYQYDEGIALPNIENCLVKGIGSELSFVAEPDNEYDKRAIKIIADDMFLGYVYKGRIQDMIHDFTKRQEPIYAKLASIDDDESKATMVIAFYIDPFRVAAKYENVSTKLIKTSKRIDEYTNRQDACSSLTRGEVLELEFDVETDTYIALNDIGEEVGEINKKISDSILEKEDEFEVVCLVDEVDEDDNGKCNVKVLVYFK